MPITAITPEQESALVEYVESGHGFVPIHCASACFPKSTKYVQLVGGHSSAMARAFFARRSSSLIIRLCSGFTTSKCGTKRTGIGCSRLIAKC